MLFFISFLVLLTCDNFLQKSSEKLDLVSSFLLNSMAFLLAGIAIAQIPSAVGILCRKRRLYLFSGNLLPLSSHLFSRHVMEECFFKIGVLVKLKMDYASVTLQRVSVLLNYQKSLCPLLFPLYFSNFPFMHFSLNSACVV